MHSTSASLLLRVRSNTDRQAWDRLVELYTPLLFFWAKKLAPAPVEAADLVQEVFVILLQKLPEFEYDRGKTFRGWLWTLLVNKWREFRRRPQAHALPPDSQISVDDNVAEMADQEYRAYLVQRAMELMRDEFQPNTWQACWRHLVSGKSAAEVGSELGMSENAVYLASSRVFRRLRQELQELLD